MYSYFRRICVTDTSKQLENMTGIGYKSMPSSASGVPLIRPSVFRQVTDFANVFKAFIGTNWIGLPFAFKQSGIVLGVVGVLIIALITDHCCQLIIKCKKAAVQKVLDILPQSKDVESQNVNITQIRNTVEKRMLFGEIGRIALGKWGVLLVNVALLATQYGFCIGYFIFMGNTITSMFPTTTETYVTRTIATISPAERNSSLANMNSSTILVRRSHLVNHAPAFGLLILVPLIPLILFSYIRSVRKLGPVSFAANVALLVAFVSVVGYMLSGLKFKLKELKLSCWATLPVFFGQVTSAYEGIGTLIPIETSMAENRHRFPLYLHFAIGTLSVILGCFGILGYVVYGEEVNQIVTESLPSGVLIQVVRCLLCFAILLTYPLQIFPVIEIIEGWLFSSECNPVENSDGEIEASSEVGDVSCQMSKGAVLDSASETSRLLAPEIPKQKSIARKWKKNLLRTFLVLTTAGIAIALKDDFAYVSAIVGSIGSSTLGFILPCVFHLVLCKDSSTTLTRVKDCLFIAFGILGGVIGVAVTIQQIVEQFTKS